MTYNLDRLIKIFGIMEECGTLDNEIETFTNGQYSDVKTLDDLVSVLEDEISYYEE